MEFDQFIQKLSTRLAEALPGPLAHEPMRATSVGGLFPKFEHATPPKPGSVLILLYPHEGSIRFPLILRPDYSGTHSGQVSFPGGKAEAGETPIETALRECEEEIGVSPSAVTVIGRLSDFFVIPSNFQVVPIVATCSSRPIFMPDPKEVVKVLEGDIASLLHQDAIKKKEILAAKQFKMMAPHFEIEGEVVWGATAMMLNELREIAKVL